MTFYGTVEGDAAYVCMLIHFAYYIGMQYILQAVLRRGRDRLQRAWGACSILVVNMLILSFRHSTLKLFVTMMHPVHDGSMIRFVLYQDG